MIETEVAVVGAGPAGLAAAEAAAAQGCRVVVLDDQPRPGGQYLRRPAPELRRRGRDRFGSEPALARRLFAVLERDAVDYRPRTTVWHVPEPGVLAWSSPEAAGRVRARAVVIAAGAHERVTPFPGWTLPGVITAGGAQNLIKGQRMLPGRRVAVAGSGPLLLVVAATLARAGAQIVAVAEAASSSAGVAHALPGLLAAPGLLALGAAYRARLLAAGVPIRTGHTVIEARGDGVVSEVLLAPIDTAGHVDRDHACTYAADALVTGFGLACSSELARLAGCDSAYDGAAGGWLVARDSWLETSIAGTFAAGDGARIGGARSAIAEGALAGLAAARRVRGALTPAGSARVARLRRTLARLARFRDALEMLFAGPASYAALMRTDTLVCRCEDVDLAMIEAARAEGMTSLVQLKSRTRAGMGRCQGRCCLATLAEIATAGRPADARWPRVRPPARQVPIGDLLREDLPFPALPADPHLPRET